LQGLWPQFLLGLLLAAGLLAVAPGGLPWAAPTLAALGLAIPFACVTAGRWMGGWMRRLHLCAVPDEYAPAPELRRLNDLATPPKAA
ncbi:MAG TPA: glucan biosynthesis glucosyltransferase H, partial [Dongiaceae bacterium]